MYSSRCTCKLVACTCKLVAPYPYFRGMNAERDEVCTARSSDGVSPPLSPVGFLRLAIIVPADLRGQTPVAKTEDTSLCPRKRARACLHIS